MNAGVDILLELVAQRAERDPENLRRMGAVAEAMIERVENEIALDVGDGAPDECARHRFGLFRRAGCRIARQRAEAFAVRRANGVGPDLDIRRK